MPDSQDITNPPDSRRGLILINTGAGKGKTTAALGTAFRAAGNGMRVLVLQFLKGSWHYGELDSAEALSSKDGFTYIIRQMGRGFVKVGGAQAEREDLEMVEAAWAEASEAILSGDWDLIVLDEIHYAIGYKMLDAEVVAAVRPKPTADEVTAKALQNFPTWNRMIKEVIKMTLLEDTATMKDLDAL